MHALVSLERNVASFAVRWHPLLAGDTSIFLFINLAAKLLLLLWLLFLLLLLLLLLHASSLRVLADGGCRSAERSLAFDGGGVAH